MQQNYDAIVLAGAEPGHPQSLVAGADPNKALIPVNGRPMVAYVVDALAASGVVRRIVLVGLDPDALAGVPMVTGTCELHYLPNQGSLFANLARGSELAAAWRGGDAYVLVTVADVPLLTGGIVSTFIDLCRPAGADGYFAIVDKPVMERTFPAVKRSYMRLVEGQFCNGSIFLIHSSAVPRLQARVNELIDARKNVVTLVRRLGFGLLLRFLVRRLRIQDVINVAQTRFAINGRAIKLPYAESGMDIDKPEHLAQVEAHMQRQALPHA
jgi:CTP:molybdopterin cytidylyltransferase MocA